MKGKYTNKPLKDWTLEEAKAECASWDDDCVGCVFLKDKYECMIDGPAKDFELDECSFTEDDIRLAKALLLIGADVVVRDGDNVLAYGSDGNVDVKIKSNDYFSSIKYPKTVYLKEVARMGEKS